MRPVIEALSAEGALVSIDTRKPAVMEAAAAAGAGIINDVTGLTGDPRSFDTAVALGLPLCLMHMQGEPQTMQADPQYDDAPAEVFTFLAGQAMALMEAGVSAEKICLDPGIGFGKTLEHNLQIMARLDEWLSGGRCCSSLAQVVHRQDTPAGPKNGWRVTAAVLAVLAGSACSAFTTCRRLCRRSRSLKRFPKSGFKSAESSDSQRRQDTFSTHEGGWPSR